MIAVNKCCGQRNVIEINGRAGNESRPACTEGESGRARGNRGRLQRLIQQRNRISGCGGRIDLDAQKTVVSAYASRVRHRGIEVPRSAAGRSAADDAAVEIELQSIRYRTAHFISGKNGP